MSIRQFVSGSSVILAGWLGATFLNEVPAQRYPKLDKGSPGSSMIHSPEKPVADVEAGMAFMPVKLSR